MSKVKVVLLAVIALVISFFSAYLVGYNTAETKYLTQIKLANSKIKELESREAIIEKEIVTVYKDKVRNVKQIEEKIVEVTKYVLREESANCTIGPGFIGLHNAAASQDLPWAAQRANGSTEASWTATGRCIAWRRIRHRH